MSLSIQFSTVPPVTGSLSHFAISAGLLRLNMLNSSVLSPFPLPFHTLFRVVLVVVFLSVTMSYSLRSSVTFHVSIPLFWTLSKIVCFTLLSLKYFQFSVGSWGIIGGRILPFLLEKNQCHVCTGTAKTNSDVFPCHGSARR